MLTLALERLASETGLGLPEGETSALARSLPSWPVFDDVRSGLGEARDRGWRLGILSNTDRDLIDASMVEIGIAFQPVIVAGEIGSYKPAKRHWEVFREETGDDCRHVHVAQSLFHDIVPASELGIPTIWINRQDEPEDPRPSVTLPGVATPRRRAGRTRPGVSSLRARCPDCRTFTAVAVGSGYECHSCGRTFAAGLVRVPRAWGAGGEGMAEGARVPLPYPEVAVVERDTLEEQTDAVAEALAERP